MTPLAALVIALIAGWIMRDARRAAAVAIIPFLAVLAAQTWGIADGRGVSPPSTVTPLAGAWSYYVVQVIILAFLLTITMELGIVRGRRTTAADAAAGVRRRAVTASVTLAVLTLSFLAAYWLTSAPVLHHSADGGPPPQGIIGLVLCLVAFVVLNVMVFTGRRSKTAAALVSDPASTPAPATGSASHAATRTMAVLAVGAAAALTVTAAHAPAKAATTASSGVIHIYEVSTGGHTNHNITTGFITDFGTDHLDVLDHGQANKIVLSQGSFEANVSTLHHRLKVVASNPQTCSLVLRAVAPVPLSHGTGKYAGIHGTLQVTVQNEVIFPKKNGKCSEDITKPTLANLTSVTGSGRVSL